MTLKEANVILANRYIKIIGSKDQHIRNMCLTIIDKVDTMPDDKTSRWIGFIQARVIELKLTTIEKERNFSRPLFHSVYENMNIPIPESITVEGINSNDEFEEHF